MMKTHNRGWK